MVTVIKADGTAEEFQIQKLKRSLRRSGAVREEVREIAAQIERELDDGIENARNLRPGVFIAAR